MKKASSYPLTTVVILTRNRRDELRTTLRNIMHELDYPQDRIELIVCDNASDDGTNEMLREEFPSVSHIRLPVNTGIQGWNQGLVTGSGEYFLLLDDDAHIEGDNLKNAIEILENQKDAGILSFNVIDPRTGYSYTRHFPYGIFSFWGCAVLIKKRLIATVGGFDPNIFIYSHEPEFVLRAAKAGFRHLVRPDLTAYHRKDPSKSGGVTDFKSYHEHFSCYYTYLKHLHAYPYLKYLGLAIMDSFKETAGRGRQGKKPLLLLPRALFRAWRLGRRSASPRDGDLEKFVFENDPRCALLATRLWSRTPQDLRSRYLDFFKTRKSLFPEFEEEFLVRWVVSKED